MATPRLWQIECIPMQCVWNLLSLHVDVVGCLPRLTWLHIEVRVRVIQSLFVVPSHGTLLRTLFESLLCLLGHHTLDIWLV